MNRMYPSRVSEALRASLVLPGVALVAGLLAGCSGSDAQPTPPMLGDDDASITAITSDAGADDTPTGDGGGTVLGACSSPAEGCPCATEGATASCGEVVRRSGSYTTCSVGQRTCTKGKWGACVGDSVAATK